MPWEPTYKSAWQTFLTTLAKMSESLYDPFFVSVAVAGPTASSEEIMLPSNQNTDSMWLNAQPGGLTPDKMWTALLNYFFGNPSDPTTYNKVYLNTDQAFIDEWKNAIDMYGNIFTGLTLTVSTGSGLPHLTGSYSLPPITGSSPTNFSTDCPTPNMDCAAEASILSYFEIPGVGGPNAKATQTDGLKGFSPGVFLPSVTLDLGVMGAKLVSQSTEFTSPSAQILGGAQFAEPFSQFPVQEGCTSKFPNDGYSGNGSTEPAADVPSACFAPGSGPSAYVGTTATFNDIPVADRLSPEQAAFNVLKPFFDGTSVTSFFGYTEPNPGTVPLNYLQIYGPDIEYADKNIAGWTLNNTGALVSGTTAQSLLNQASNKLLKIAE
jgi:hypothetical protein